MITQGQPITQGQSLATNLASLDQGQTGAEPPPGGPGQLPGLCS
jgi:hypothetical protein